MTDATTDPTPDPVTDVTDTGLPAPVHPDIKLIPMPLYDPNIVLDKVGWIALGVDRGYCSPASATDPDEHPDAPPSSLIVEVEQSSP